MKRLLCIFMVFLSIESCSNEQTKIINKYTDTVKFAALQDTSFEGLIPYQSDTVSIASKKYVLTVYKKDSTSFFIVQRLVNGQFKTIMKDPNFETNNSTLFFKTKIMMVI